MGTKGSGLQGGPFQAVPVRQFKQSAPREEEEFSLEEMENAKSLIQSYEQAKSLLAKKS